MFVLAIAAMAAGLVCTISASDSYPAVIMVAILYAFGMLMAFWARIRAVPGPVVKDTRWARNSRILSWMAVIMLIAMLLDLRIRGGEHGEEPSLSLEMSNAFLALAASVLFGFIGVVTSSVADRRHVRIRRLG